MLFVPKTMVCQILNQLASNEPKLDVIRRWLQQAGLTGDMQKKLIDNLKETLFDNLKPSQIEEKYFDLLSTLATKITQNNNSAI